jgi:hypothetical protein
MAFNDAAICGGLRTVEGLFWKLSYRARIREVPHLGVNYAQLCADLVFSTVFRRCRQPPFYALEKPAKSPAEAVLSLPAGPSWMGSPLIGQGFSTEALMCAT